MSVLYLASSAVVPLYIAEANTTLVQRATADALASDGICSATITFAEVKAALARAQRGGRFVNANDHERVVAAFEKDWKAKFITWAVSNKLAQLAGELAEIHGLRGYDAVQLAAALALEVKLGHAEGEHAKVELRALPRRDWQKASATSSIPAPTSVAACRASASRSTR